jgi:hypothetical protein
VTRKKMYAKAVSLLRRVVKSERKKSWEEGESLEGAIDAVREFLGDLRAQRAAKKAMDEVRREEGL